jgi:hypothetical protein
MEYATYRYTVQAPGVYYIHLTAGIYYTGTAGYPVKMELLVNGVASVNVYRTSTQHFTMTHVAGQLSYV